jgi:hypothetical protein
MNIADRRCNAVNDLPEQDHIIGCAWVDAKKEQFAISQNFYVF